ncbi:lipoprotein-releasing ABC transporter ATP-binding protein LolD [Leeia oryzae]|uniref:lipoprotein-releasing ABC transporter ATP-binding protein LolD n=1 Tax=Leeia oryzae TaxID=356662 RepID=UPI00037F822F|nr:lipoprotein-releasing ABC transporter ATP-binding protein LolD [Leeia oryzae]
MNKPVILQATSVSKRFGKGSTAVEVLTSVNLTLAHGQRAAIVGASGSGKSTLLHVLGGLDKPDSGQVVLQGQVLSGLGEAARGRLRNQSLGFVYQFHHLLPELTAQENVAMPLWIRRMDKAAAMQKALDMLKAVGLANRADHKPGALSGGERQRVAIARALVTQPSCLLADEPTGNLDRENANRVFDVMLELNDRLGTALLLVTHDMELAAKMQDVFRLQDGILSPVSAGH